MNAGLRCGERGIHTGGLPGARIGSDEVRVVRGHAGIAVRLVG
jgi:hypothetical protein